jgi:hypothetical protein
MHEEKADRGFFVTTAGFSTPAREYAQQVGIELVPGTRLLALMAHVGLSESSSDEYTLRCPECGVQVPFSLDAEMESSRCANGHRVPNALRSDLLDSRLSSRKLLCEKCGSEMRLRRGKHGRFWGCAAFPRCRHTESYRARTRSV